MLRLDECRSARFRSLAILVACSMFLLAGCWNSYSGTSDYEKFKQKQQTFTELIAAAGGTASKEGRTGFGFQMTGWFIDLSGAEINEELIAEIAKVAIRTPVFELNLSKSTITNEQLAQLDASKVFQKMVSLDLSDTAITDAGLDQLSTFHCFVELNLKGSKATVEAATRLGERQISHPDTPKVFQKQPKVSI